MKFASLILPVVAASYVNAHGILRRIWIQDTDYEGNKVDTDNPSVIRKVSTQNPVMGATNPSLTCGPDSGPAKLSANANPGDTVKLDWRTSTNDGVWKHSIGVMLTYMASCGSATCDKFNQAEAEWFKIDQVAKKEENTLNWVVDDLAKGGTAVVQIPKNLAAGNYLLRHEIIALHEADRGGAQFYPACVQLRVGGNGNGVPKQTDLVKIPGAYKDEDPGIHTPKVYIASEPYVFPGPAIAVLDAETPSTPVNPADPLTPSDPTTTTTDSPPKETCKTKWPTAPRHRRMQKLAF